MYPVDCLELWNSPGIGDINNPVIGYVSTSAFPIQSKFPISKIHPGHRIEETIDYDNTNIGCAIWEGHTVCYRNPVNTPRLRQMAALLS